MDFPRGQVTGILVDQEGSKGVPKSESKKMSLWEAARRGSGELSPLRDKLTDDLLERMPNAEQIREMVQ